MVQSAPVRVVVADDDGFVRQCLQEFIAATDDLVCVGDCANGQEVLDLLETVPADVVVMDVQMPVMDGVEATSRVRAKHPGTQVLVWTAFELDAAVDAAMNHGAAGFLLKTSTGETLTDAIRAVAKGLVVMSQRPMQHVRSGSGVRRPAEAAPDLSPREREVLEGVCRGLTNVEIGRELYVSESSVKAYLATLMNKLGARTRVKVVLRAYELGLIQEH